MGTHEQELTPRQELAVERIMADESLTGDLTDAPAKALIDWATAKVATVAGDSSLSDEQVGAYGKSVRTAIRAAIAGGHTSPEELVASAEAQLAPPSTTSIAASVAPAPQVPAATPATTKQSRGGCSQALANTPLKAARVPAAPEQPRSWVERWRRWLKKEREHDHS